MPFNDVSVWNNVYRRQAVRRQWRFPRTKDSVSVASVCFRHINYMHKFHNLNGKLENCGFNFQLNQTFSYGGAVQKCILLCAPIFGKFTDKRIICSHKTHATNTIESLSGKSQHIKLGQFCYIIRAAVRMPVKNPFRSVDKNQPKPLTMSYVQTNNCSVWEMQWRGHKMF